MSRRRYLLPATAVIGATLGATAAIWLRLDRSDTARETVAAGLAAMAILAAVLGMRLGEQRRWRRLAAAVRHPSRTGAAGGLAAQAEAARRFARADGAAIVWTETDHTRTTAATAGAVPEAFRAGAPLPPSVLIGDAVRSGVDQRPRVGLRSVPAAGRGGGEPGARPRR